MTAFVRANLPVTAVALVPEITLHTAQPDSGLRRMLETCGGGETSPYWAYPWAGGIALARYLLDTPELVAGRNVLDLGTGSGLVGIAAAKAGARSVIAAETDANAHAAIGLNAELNGVPLVIFDDDLLPGNPPAVDLVVAGDVYYNAGIATRMTAFFDRCLDAGIAVLIGDPRRAYLPGEGLQLLAEYEVPDFGTTRTAPPGYGCVYARNPPPREPAS
ncbi:MAG: 50S ribosomal protein L11 methyltransferase [Rhizobiaceae bacterium]